MVYLSGENRVLVFSTASYTDIVPGINPFDGSPTPGPALGLSSKQAGVLDPIDSNGVDGIGVRAGGEPNHRVEGLCMAYSLDPQKGLVLQNTAYITNNDSPDWQNAHKMLAVNIDDHAAVAMYGFDPDGTNTKTYAQAVGPNCELLSAQTKILAKTNDNVGGLYTSFVRNVRSATETQIVSGEIGNGNGEDDGWIVSMQVLKTGSGASTYTLSKEFDQAVVQNEERSRGTIRRIANDPDHLLVIYAEGNNQPPDNAVKISKVNISKNFTGNTDPNNAGGGRVEFRQTLMARQGNLYYTTPDLVEVTDATGLPTDKYIANWVQVNTSNRNGRQKGRTAIQSVPLQYTTTGVTMMDQPKEGLFGMADGAHPGFIQATYGQDNRSVAMMVSGNITDGAGAAMKIVGVDSAGHLEAIRALNWADFTSGGYSSQWYGHNPNTPQGRTYPAQGILVANPGYGVTGGFQPSVKTFMVLAHAHHMDHSGQCGPSDPTPADPNKGTNNGTCGGKNATSLVMIPVNSDPNTDGDQGGDPTNPDDPTPVDPTASGSTLGGCSTTGAGGMGTLLLLGLALSTARRRRK